MIQTGFEPRVKVQEIITNQLPSFILDENPKAVDFFKQYYISQEYQGGTTDLSENLDQYLKVDNLIPEVIVDTTKTVGVTTVGDSTINVNSTKAFPDTYGLLKIDDEIITYTGKTPTSFTGCVRGFSGITNYHESNNSEELVFSTSNAASHADDSSVQNLSTLFLKEFYTKLKSTFTPGLENVEFSPLINAGNFIKEARSFYESKGTDDSFKILCKVLYGIDPTIVNLENYLIKPSSTNFIRRYVTIAEVISGNPLNLIGQQITKSTDPGTNASVSDVETFTRNNIQYFKISLFIGYDDLSTVRGTFVITPSSKVTEKVEVGSSVISVDSTVGFEESGTIVSGNNTITYTSKSINQFYGCTGVSEEISAADNLRSDVTYFGYENGDTSKKVELRLTGVLSNFVQISDNLSLKEGDIIGVKNLGSNIKNPSNGKTFKEIFANSWIYNTSSRYKIDNIDNGFTLKSDIDRSSLKKGDRVEILDRDSLAIKSSETNVAFVSEVNETSNSIILGNNSFVESSNQKYDLRRKLNTANSINVSIEGGNDKILSDVLNVYDERGEYAYVASNSLPSGNRTTEPSIEYAYNITKKVNTSFISEGIVGVLTDIQTDGTYSTLRFSEPVSFSNGDEVYYKPDVAPLVGLETGSYFVGISSSDGKQVNLYSSRSFVGSSNYLTFSPEPNGHRFTLNSQRSNLISPQKVLKKFSLNPNIKNGKGEVTTPGTTGMLINGVEISNYKSDDKIYFGPLKSINVFNGGKDYDVINLPTIQVSNPNVSTGTTALVQPVVSGSIEKVYVDPQDFDINSIVSIGVTGGNGTGANLDVSLIKRSRNVFFNAKTSLTGGGINTATDQIIFDTDHNFINGEEIIYSNESNTSVGYADTLTLVTQSSYFCRVDNNRTIRLFENLSDSLSGINTINFTDGGTGTQKFSPAKTKNTINNINVIDGGSNYTNRNLMVKPVGINTGNHTVNFENHGFDDGDTIVYRNLNGVSWSSPDIVGVGVTTLTYKILKVDNDSFKLANIGVAGTNLSNFDNRESIRFETVGSGVHSFKFPDISVSINYTSVGFGTTTQSYQTITATPVVRGNIIDAYLYESGTGYGSTILNHHQRPLVEIKTGSDALISAAIINGKFETITVDSGGRNYSSLPTIEIKDPTGVGVGAELRPIISNGALTSVTIVNPGIGYSTSTTVRVKTSGSNGLLSADVRDLSLNNQVRFGDELLFETKNNLQYTVLSYFDSLRTAFKEDVDEVSYIIGWAYDGNPIYGPYAYTDPENTNSDPKRVTSSYELSTADIIDRPVGFAAGYFKEDYKFTNSGDLDEYNGMFAKTREFPNGVYAYYATLDASDNPQFPYFIGDKYRSNTLTENESLTQGFDFNNSNLLRNTFPYKISDKNADNDFIIETSEVVDQKSVVESATKGSISGFDIINAGDNYKVNDVVDFNSTETGGGLIARVSEIKGRPITSVDTTIEEYTNAVITVDSDKKVRVNVLPKHDIVDSENIVLSGLSTQLSQLNNSFVAGVTSFTSTLIEDIATGTSGLSTEIYLSQIPPNVSVGSSIGIGTEFLTVLEVFDNLNVLKVERSVTGLAHTAPLNVGFIPDSFTIDANLDIFDSKVNDKVFFNPSESVGVGTIVGIGTTIAFSFGNSNITRNIQTKTIAIENHPFENNQEVTYTADGVSVGISTTSTSAVFDMPSTVFIVDKNVNSIGIKTTLTSSEVFFRTATSTSDKHSFESKFNQITGKVQRISANVGISTLYDDELSVNDSISLNIKPNLTVGIGTSTAVRVQRDTVSGNILINPINFNAAAINVNTDQINIVGHGFKTGDKVNYSANTIATGLSTQTYYVFRVDDDNIKLATTEINVFKNPPTVVNITAQGGSPQTLSPINPQIKSIKNNNLVFDVTDASLQNYNLKFYYDNEYNNEIVSISTTSSFTIVGVGTVGVSTNASVTINNTESLPKKLYYNLERAGSISTTDKEVKNFSEILFTDSSYNGDYKVFSKGTNSFQIFLKEVPERLSYASTECSVLSYDTTSTNASGPVSKLNLVSGGSNYEKLPQFEEIKSANGKDAFILAKSNDIGNASLVRVLNEGFEYSSDKTLQPTADIDTFIEIKDSNTIGIVSITEGGKNYLSSPPTITIVNPTTRQKIDSGVLIASLTSNSITKVEVLREPKGLPETTVELFAENNTNGVSIQRIDSRENSGIITCHLTTPSVGFGTQPFNIGDQAFLEGVTTYSGTGYNSSDIGYRFYNVTGYDPNGQFGVQVTLENDTITNAGVAVTDQGSASILINKDDYPILEPIQKKAVFAVGERILINGIESDLFVSDVEESFVKIKVTGSNIKVGDVLQGVDTGNIATVITAEYGDGIFNIDYNLKKDIGWQDNIGMLDNDDQVVPDNDYYQNLSYSIKSPLTYEKTTEVIKGTLHTSGMRDFADTGITSTTTAGVSDTEDQTSIFKDIITETRVDTLRQFDFARDIDVVNDVSKFVVFKNRRLTNYIDCTTNRVLSIDNINSEFSNLNGDPSTFINIFKLDQGVSYYDNLIKVSSTSGDEMQVSDLVILESNGNYTLFDRGTVVNRGTDLLHNNGDLYGEFSIFTDSLNESYFRFTPTNVNDIDYDLKTRSSQFTSSAAGIATRSIGFIDLTSSTGVTTLTGITTAIYTANTTDLDGLFADLQVINTVTDEMNFVSVYMTHDDADTFISDYYFDSDMTSVSLDEIGEFGANIVSGIVSFTYTSDTDDDITVRGRVVGFGTTARGNGIYRFKSIGQADESERTVVYRSEFVDNVSAATTIFSLDSNLFDSCKSYVRVSVGSSSALHQVIMLQDSDDDIYLQQSPFLSVNSLTGLGTFITNLEGTSLDLQFDPDTTDPVNISVFSECFYSSVDTLNVPQDLTYGNTTEEIKYDAYNAINGDRINKTEFELRHNQVPIFAKTFDPSGSSVDLATGVFSIDNHFFSNNEELIYTPKSTFVGVGSTAMQYENSTAGVTGTLPSTVFAIVTSDNSFQISTTSAGTAVTFTSVGEGNAHMFEMAEKNSKSLIIVDNIVQYPLSFSDINHALDNNGGSIGIGSTVFALAGISTIKPKDVLRIDNEYMSVENVGFGTTNVGPITNTGSVPLVQVKRGFVGTAASVHQDTTGVATVFKGGYNIVGKDIFFTDPPRGNPQFEFNESNLETAKSDFNGRVFLRQDYATNQIYDDISTKFTGIATTFELTLEDNSSIGIGTTGGNGIVFLNGVFQTPTTANNPENNFEIIEDTVAGVSSIRFSGIRDSSDNLFTSDADVNIGQLPRGGMIVSLGSTGGLGYAPLVGAAVTAVVVGGAIQNSIGIGTTDNVGSGYNHLVAIGVSVFESGHAGNHADITATVGVGGTLTFTVNDGGSGYTNPQIFVSEPSYAGLGITGVSRIGVGATTDTGRGLLLDIEVGASSSTGIGSTMFEVTGFKIARTGYSFEIGDVFTPVGLVTDRGLTAPVSQFNLEVLDTFTDNFGAWQFGELDYIDSIKNLQDGNRTRFPLFYNNELLSFETPTNSLIDLNSCLLIMIDGVVQVPGEAYTFEGGTAFSFTDAPLKDSKVDIFFYRGTRGADSTLVTDIDSTIERGDEILILKNNAIRTTKSQTLRTVLNLTTSKKVETDRYIDEGINENDYKPVDVIKQKVDKVVNGDRVFKTRDSIEGQIYPVSKVIADFSTTDTQIFLDNTDLFDYPGGADTPASIEFMAVAGIGSTDAVGNVEFITGATDIEGFSGIITGITTSAGTNGHTLALEFSLKQDSFADLNVGYPIYISDTRLGTGATSVFDTNAAVVSIGQTFLDNVYHISALHVAGNLGIITCNIHTDSPVVGLSSFGDDNNPVGTFSWGRLAGFARGGSPISIGVTGLTVPSTSVGISTFPIAQRRGVGLRDNGSLPKQL